MKYVRSDQISDLDPFSISDAILDAGAIKFENSSNWCRFWHKCRVMFDS